MTRQDQTQCVMFVMERMQTHEVAALGGVEMVDNQLSFLVTFSGLGIPEIHRKGSTVWRGDRAGGLFREPAALLFHRAPT